MKKQLTVLEQFKEACRKYLIIENDEYIDMQFGVVFANTYLDEDPIATLASMPKFSF